MLPEIIGGFLLSAISASIASFFEEMAYENERAKQLANPGALSAATGSNAHSTRIYFYHLGSIICETCPTWLALSWHRHLALHFCNRGITCRAMHRNNNVAVKSCRARVGSLNGAALQLRK